MCIGFYLKLIVTETMKRTLFQNRFGISIFALLVAFHNLTPYAHMSFKTTLHINSNNLFPTESLHLLPTIQCNLRSRNLNCFLLVQNCCCQLNFHQEARLGALSLTCAICWSQSVTTEQFFLLLVNVMWVDLFSLAIIFQYFNDCWTLFLVLISNFKHWQT